MGVNRQGHRNKAIQPATRGIPHPERNSGLRSTATTWSNHLTAKFKCPYPLQDSTHWHPGLVKKMEAFHLLSRGGVNFDKQRFKGDVKLFNVCFIYSSRSPLLRFSSGLLIMTPRLKTEVDLRTASFPLSLTFSNTQWRGLRNANLPGLVEKVMQGRRGTGRKTWLALRTPMQKLKQTVTAVLLPSPATTLHYPDTE